MGSQGLKMRDLQQFSLDILVGGGGGGGGNQQEILAGNIQLSPQS
jgi:hypothetical protein